MSDTHEPAPGRYRHFKGGLYEVLGTASHSETADKLVVYRALYGRHELWVRPVHMFTEEVMVEGTKKPRFQRLLEESTDNRDVTPRNSGAQTPPARKSR